MQRIVMKSKIHRATVTKADLYYEGSLTLDKALMEAADVLPFERVQVVNLNNGERFETYVIAGERDSGIVCLNGPAARLGTVGDEIIILTYGAYGDEELRSFRPTVVHVNKENRIIEIVKGNLTI
ncbi:MAG: aspartate 1-decarboxylase [Bacteroidota bacterium]